MTHTVIFFGRNRKGDLVIEYRPEVIGTKVMDKLAKISQFLVSLFRWMDDVSYRLPVTSAIGLGVGVSLAWFIYSQPMATVATPEVTVSRTVPIFEALRKAPDEMWLPFETQASPVVLQLGFEPYMTGLSLGDTVELLGSNNGVYTYQIVEIRYLTTSQARTFQPPSDTLILQVSLNLLDTERALFVLK